MALIITSPRKSANGIFTDVVAVESQEIYPCQRQDDQVTSLGTINGNARVSVADNQSQFYSANDKVYVSIEGEPIPTQVYTVIGIVFISPDTFLELNYPWTTGQQAVTGFINRVTERENYYISVEVRDAADTFSVFDEVFRYVPPRSGFIYVDIGAILNAYMKGLGLFSFQHFARFSEAWTGSGGPVSTTFNGTIGDGGYVKLLNIPAEDANALSVGTNYYYIPNGGAYLPGWYECISVEASAATFIIEFQAGQEGVTGRLNSYQDLDEMQGIDAFKQIGKVGGALMWENLLNQGSGTGGDSMPDIPFEDIPDTGRDGAGIPANVPWDIVQPDLLQCELNVNETELNELRLFEEGQLFPGGTSVGFNIVGTIEITNFVSTGTIEARCASEANQIFLSVDILDVTGNQAATPFEATSAPQSVGSDQNELLFYFRSILGEDFTATIKVTSLTVTFPGPGKLLTKFESDEPVTTADSFTNAPYLYYPEVPMVQFDSGFPLSQPWDVAGDVWTYSKISTNSDYSSYALQVENVTKIYNAGDSLRIHLQLTYEIAVWSGPNSSVLAWVVFGDVNGVPTQLFRTGINTNIIGTVPPTQYAFDFVFSIADNNTNNLRFYIEKNTSNAFSTDITVDPSNGDFLHIGDAPVINPGKTSRISQDNSSVIWEGWNRTVAYIMDDSYEFRNNTNGFKIGQYPCDANKVSLGGQTLSPGLDVSSPYVGVFKLLDTKTFPGSEAFLLVRSFNNDFTAELAEPLYFEWRPECKNAVMLDWLPVGGGVDQWLFTDSQIVDNTSGEGVLTQRPIDGDYQDVTRTKRRFSAPFVQRMTLNADHLTTAQLLALQEIKQTESLRVYLSKDGQKFVDAVVVSNYTTQYRTDQLRHRFIVTIEFPDNFDFYSAKLY